MLLTIHSAYLQHSSSNFQPATQLADVFLYDWDTAADTKGEGGGLESWSRLFALILIEVDFEDDVAHHSFFVSAFDYFGRGEALFDVQSQDAVEYRIRSCSRLM